MFPGLFYLWLSRTGRALLVLALRHAVFHKLVVSLAVAVDVDGRIDGAYHRLRVGFVAAGHFVGGAVVRRCPDIRQPGREIDAVRECECLEWCETLVVVHRECGVEPAVVAEPEISVRGVRTIGKDPFLLCLLDCREDDVALLVSEKAAVAAVGVEPEHCNFRLVNTEVPLQRVPHQAQLPQDAFGGNGA